MRSVVRSPEPAFFAELRAAHSRWDELDGASRSLIRADLAKDFGSVCGYCQSPCQAPTSHKRREEETIDHFRPRHHFPAQWLDWLNLVYACRRCNVVAKGDSWPGYVDALANQVLADKDARYTPITEYVNPSAVDCQRPADDFFDFDPATGEMLPSEQLGREEWSMARRTIADIDLNDSSLSANDRSHLWNRRLAQRNLLVARLNALDDFDLKVNIMLEFMQPDKPFSAFIRAYILDRFPLFREFFR